MKHKMEEVSSMKMKPTLSFNDKEVNIGKASVGDKYSFLVSGTVKRAEQMYDDKKHTEYTLEINDMKIQSGKEKTKAGEAIDKRLV